MFKIATVFLYASLTGFSLILGVIIGTTLKISQKVIAAINALNEKYEDMIKSGILDPTKVVRIALQNASSIAGLLLTTEGLVADLPEEEKGSKYPAPPGGDMY